MGWLTTLAGSNGSPGLGLCLHLATRCVHMMRPVYRVANGKCHHPGIMSVLSVSSVSSTQTNSGEIHFSPACEAVTLGRGYYERILRVGGGGRERAQALTLGYIGTSEGRDIGTSAP